MNDESDNEPAACREFVHARLIDAPRAQVFMAFADPSRLARWWGPDGFTSTFRTFELRAGGEWRFVMHGADGTDYPNHSVFVDVVPAERERIAKLVVPANEQNLSRLAAEVERVR